MSETILAAEPTIRLAIFLGVLVAMALWEVAAPRRRREIPRVIRWTNNLALVVVDTIILRLSFPIIAVGLAVMAEDRGWGLFNNIDAPFWVAVVVSMLLLDLAIYLQHVDVPRRARGSGGCTGCTTPIWTSMPPRGCAFHPVEILDLHGDQAGGGRRPRPTRHCRAAV